VLGSIAGRIAVEHLTPERIRKMDELAARLKRALEEKAAALGLSLFILVDGSVMGLYFATAKPRPGSDVPNPDLSARFHLACLNHGVQMGPGGMVSMATVIDDATMDEVIDGMGRALADVAP